jgi:hypothetical protein
MQDFRETAKERQRTLVEANAEIPPTNCKLRPTHVIYSVSLYSCGTHVQTVQTAWDAAHPPVVTLLVHSLLLRPVVIDRVAIFVPQ